MKKFLRILKNTALALLLGIYVYTGFSAAGYLLTRATVRAQDVSILPHFIDMAIEQKKPEKIALWISQRKKEDAEKIAETLAAKADVLSYETFLTLSRLFYTAHKLDDSYFWMQYARYRLRYDALRCGGSTGAADIARLIDATTPPEIDAAAEKRPALLKKSLIRVLNLDEKKPPRNDPATVCKIIGVLEGRDAAPLPAAQQAPLRAQLRAATQRAIGEMQP